VQKQGSGAATSNKAKPADAGKNTSGAKEAGKRGNGAQRLKQGK